jgi:hypothetical protein
MLNIIINIAIVILTAVGVIIAYFQLKKISKSHQLETLQSFDEKNAIINAERKKHIVETANKTRLRNQVIDYLVEEMHKREDPTERYWIYIALGEIGGKRAKAAINEGLSDVNEFARLGAEAAYNIIKSRWKRFKWLLVILLLLISAFVTILLLSKGNHSNPKPATSKMIGMLSDEDSIQKQRNLHNYEIYQKSQTILRIEGEMEGEIFIIIIDTTGACSSYKLTIPSPIRYLEMRF